ncbi:MAG: aminoacyl-tRNA hydrolase [Nitriliruptoraceae bacterium]
MRRVPRWLVVGLGNPEAEYGGTRHNVGADAVRAIATGAGGAWSRNKRVRADVVEVRGDAARLILLLPATYMNRSGEPVQSASAWYNVPAERVIVCHDDLDVALGSLRIKRGGGHAGHNGLRDIDRALGTADYLRVRIGIGRPPEHVNGRDYVLQRFTADQRDAVDPAIGSVADVVSSLIDAGLESTQNRFHAR